MVCALRCVHLEQGSVMYFYVVGWKKDSRTSRFKLKFSGSTTVGLASGCNLDVKFHGHEEDSGEDRAEHEEVETGDARDQ
ncbi:hypothetical protein SLE2022_163380 [Rubroshorea leprosula]